MLTLTLTDLTLYAKWVQTKSTILAFRGQKARFSKKIDRLFHMNSTITYVEYSDFACHQLPKKQRWPKMTISISISANANGKPHNDGDL